MLLCRPAWSVPPASDDSNLTLCRADLDGNKTVDILDVAAIAGAFGRADRYAPVMDLTDDGAIDIFDVAVLARLFGQAPPPHTRLAVTVQSADDSLSLQDPVVIQGIDTVLTWRDGEGRLVMYLFGATSFWLTITHAFYLPQPYWFAPSLSDTSLSCNLKPDPHAPAVTVAVRTDSLLGTVSPYLTGFNSLFCHVTDSIRADGRLTNYLKNVQAGILRFPGGEVSSQYHWELPGYPPWSDGRKTNPDLDPALAPDTPEYMDTDEYIAWCRLIGAEPMIGVNLESGAKYDKDAEGVAEAVRWVQYCKDHDYRVRYWFFDNETYLPGTYQPMTVEEYAGRVRMYGSAMRAVDPDIQFIVNWQNPPSNSAVWSEWEYLLATAGDYINIFDIHQYWQWNSATWDNWLKQSPMHMPNTELSFAEEIRQFNERMQTQQRDVRLAVLEWNRGPNDAVTASPFQNALIQSEMLHQFIQGGLYMASFWPLNWTSNQQNRAFIDPNTLEARPIYDIFRLYAEALGKTQVACTSDNVQVPALAVQNAAGDTLLVWLLHKSLTETLATLDPGDFEADTVQAVTVTADTPDADQAVTRTAAFEYRPSGGTWRGVLPPYSVTRLTFLRQE